MPQGQRQIATVSNAGILADQRSPKRGALAVVKLGDGPRATVTSTGKIAAIELCHASEKKSLHEDPGIVEPFAKRDRFLSEICADPKIAAHDMEREISPHDSEELWRLPHSLAQRMCATENRTNFRRCIASPRDVCGA